MASGHYKYNKPDLKALYSLEFYKKKKKWKLSSDKVSPQPQTINDDPKIVRSDICNETYDVDTKFKHEEAKPSILDAAFVDDIPIDKIPSPQVTLEVQATSSQPFEDIHIDQSSVLAPEPLNGRCWIKQDSQQVQHCYPVLHEMPSNCLQKLLCPRKWPSPTADDLQNTQEIQISDFQETNANWNRDELSEVIICKDYPNTHEHSDNWRNLRSPNAFSEPVSTLNFSSREKLEKYMENYDHHVDNWVTTEIQEIPSADVYMDLNQVNSCYNQVSESYLTALDNAYNVLETWNNLRSKSDPSLEQAWQYQQVLWHNRKQASALTNYAAASCARDDLFVRANEATPIRAAETINARPHRSLDESRTTPGQIRQRTDRWLHRLATVYKQNEDRYTDQQSFCDPYQYGYNDSEVFIREAHHVPHSSEKDPDETADCDHWSLHPGCLTDVTMHHATNILRAAVRQQLLRDYLRRRESIEEYTSCSKELYAFDEILDGSHLPHVTAMLEVEENRGSHIKINMGRPYRM